MNFGIHLMIERKEAMTTIIQKKSLANQVAEGLPEQITSNQYLIANNQSAELPLNLVYNIGCSNSS